MDLSPGQVWWAEPDPAFGREQSGRRPWLLVANPDYLEIVTTLVLAVPVTTTDRAWPNHIELTGRHGLDTRSFAMTEQMRALSRQRLLTCSGIVTRDCLEAARRWILEFVQE